MNVIDYPGRMTQYLKERFGNKPLIGAEIGVLNGDHALELFQTLNIELLYLIDPYKDYPDYHDHNRHGLNDVHIRAFVNLLEYNERIRWLYMFSSKAIARIEQALDFVYIDGNHARMYVLDDLWGYLPLLKTGGVIGGHDYYTRKDPDNLCEVQEVVDEFATLTGSPLYIDISYDKDWPDWWFIKDEIMVQALLKEQHHAE